jgi:hypothetical protein
MRDTDLRRLQNTISPWLNACRKYDSTYKSGTGNRKCAQETGGGDGLTDIRRQLNEDLSQPGMRRQNTEGFGLQSHDVYVYQRHFPVSVGNLSSDHPHIY